MLFTNYIKAYLPAELIPKNDQAVGVHSFCNRIPLTRVCTSKSATNQVSSVWQTTKPKEASNKRDDPRGCRASCQSPLFWSIRRFFGCYSVLRLIVVHKHLVVSTGLDSRNAKHHGWISQRHGVIQLNVTPVSANSDSLSHSTFLLWKICHFSGTKSPQSLRYHSK